MRRESVEVANERCAGNPTKALACPLKSRAVWDADSRRSWHRVRELQMLSLLVDNRFNGLLYRKYIRTRISRGPSSSLASSQSSRPAYERTAYSSRLSCGRSPGAMATSSSLGSADCE